MRAQELELIDCPSPVTEEEALAVLQRYREAPELLGRLRFWVATNSLAIMLSTDLQKEVTQLADTIEQRDR